MNISNILIVLIIIVTAIIVFYLCKNTKSPLIIGGIAAISQIPPRNRLFIPDNEKLVIDGHNMIHDLTKGKPLNILQFEKALKDISAMLSIAFPTQKLHIVVKNPDTPLIEKIYNKIKDNKEDRKLSRSKKKSSGERIPYFRELVKISTQFPNITYHLAYEKPKKKSFRQIPHHSKGRDDYLTIYLAKGGYMISKDRFRDFKQFGSIRAFKHYSVTNGEIHEKETIKPVTSYHDLVKPSIGNHMIYHIDTLAKLKKKRINPGEIYLDNDSVFSKVYLASLNN